MRRSRRRWTDVSTRVRQVHFSIGRKDPESGSDVWPKVPLPGHRGETTRVPRKYGSVLYDTHDCFTKLPLNIRRAEFSSPWEILIPSPWEATRMSLGDTDSRGRGPVVSVEGSLRWCVIGMSGTSQSRFPGDTVPTRVETPTFLSLCPPGWDQPTRMYLRYISLCIPVTL